MNAFSIPAGFVEIPTDKPESDFLAPACTNPATRFAPRSGDAK